MCQNSTSEHSHKHEIELDRNILHSNEEIAGKVKGFLEARNILALNIMSSPGAGKTTILEKTISYLKEKVRVSVIEGDQQTLNDGRRIAACGVPVIQINTGGGCHLEADMVYSGLRTLDPASNSLLFIENVGNLVCPALFNLGEQIKTVVISLPEGDDKPLKYPAMFIHSDLCLINKTDLAPYLNSSVEKLKDNLLKVNHHLKIFEMSATENAGIGEWCDWLLDRQLKNLSSMHFHEDENFTISLLESPHKEFDAQAL